jgi:hypothetical protein
MEVPAVVAIVLASIVFCALWMCYCCYCRPCVRALCSCYAWVRWCCSRSDQRPDMTEVEICFNGPETAYYKDGP